MVCMAYVSQNGLHDSINKATTDLFTFAYKHVIKPVSCSTTRPTSPTTK